MTVYFIKPVGMDGPVKVGCSYSPDKRVKTLDTWSPFALEIIAQVDGDFELERRFHALFIETHQRREWFGWSRRIATTVAAIKDGTFDLATLPEPLFVTGNSRKGKGSRMAEWTPARRFSGAYDKRMYALRDRGMPWERYMAGPRFDAYAFGNSFSPSRHRRYDDPIGQVRLCEAFADAMTAEYGHDGLKPVRWVGPILPIEQAA